MLLSYCKVKEMTSMFIKNRRFAPSSNVSELVSQKKEKLKKFVTNTIDKI